MGPRYQQPEEKQTLGTDDICHWQSGWLLGTHLGTMNWVCGQGEDTLGDIINATSARALMCLPPGTRWESCGKKVAPWRQKRGRKLRHHQREFSTCENTRDDAPRAARNPPQPLGPRRQTQPPPAPQTRPAPRSPAARSAAGPAPAAAWHVPRQRVQIAADGTTCPVRDDSGLGVSMALPVVALTFISRWQWQILRCWLGVHKCAPPCQRADLGVTFWGGDAKHRVYRP